MEAQAWPSGRGPLAMAVETGRGCGGAAVRVGGGRIVSSVRNDGVEGNLPTKIG
jgi:hypothetical protein